MRSPLFILIFSLAILWASAWIGLRFRAHIEHVRQDFAVVFTATLTLLGLIVGCAFSMAVNRYDQREALARIKRRTTAKLHALVPRQLRF